MPAKPRPPDPDRLVRDRPGSYRSEDERFGARSDGGGRWYLTDTARHDGMGLDLVLGPFTSLGGLKAAMRAQREAPAGDDGPLPEPTADSEEARIARAPVEPESPPPPPPPPRPRFVRARWRRTGDARDDALDAVRRLTEAWLAGDDATVRGLVHPDTDRDAVMRAAPDGATVTAWEERVVHVEVVDAAALVTVDRVIQPVAGAGAEAERGRDLWVLLRVGGAWLVAWRR